MGIEDTDRLYMKLALEEAERAAASGEVPVGAVVVCENDRLAKSGAQIEQPESVLAPSRGPSLPSNIAPLSDPVSPPYPASLSDAEMPDGVHAVLSVGHNLRETAKDASAHAEFLAMRKAMEALDAWRLEGCTVYVTLEPCIMCAGLMQQARIRRCVFGAFDPKGGALGTLYSINDDARLNHRFEVSGGLMQDECAAILKKFFKERRRR